MTQPFIPENISHLIEEFNKLPGIGPKSAERVVFYLLKKPDFEVSEFAKRLSELKQGITTCSNCMTFSLTPICSICSDSTRDHQVICIVEDFLDLVALEKTGEFKGVYHVLGGLISPVDGVGPDELTLAELLTRARDAKINEVVLALNPSMEGEATAQYILRILKPHNIKITRIARGIPIGGHLEYTDSQTLKRALQGRVDY